jgi:hypothetical protein
VREDFWFAISARMFQESPAATVDVAVLPGVLGCSFDYAQDKLTLRRTFKYASSTSPCDDPVARPPRLSEQARDGGQARPSLQSRYNNS